MEVQGESPVPDLKPGECSEELPVNSQMNFPSAGSTLGRTSAPSLSAPTPEEHLRELLINPSVGFHRSAFEQGFIGTGIPFQPTAPGAVRPPAVTRGLGHYLPHRMAAPTIAQPSPERKHRLSLADGFPGLGAVSPKPAVKTEIVESFQRVEVVRVISVEELEDSQTLSVSQVEAVEPTVTGVPEVPVDAEEAFATSAEPSSQEVEWQGDDSPIASPSPVRSTQSVETGVSRAGRLSLAPVEFEKDRLPLIIDSHLHLDRIEKRLGKRGASALRACPGRLPLKPVRVTGGILNYCDPQRWGRIWYPEDPSWGVAVGIHPKKADQVTMGTMNRLRSLLASQRICGVSELGLDFSIPDTTWQQQINMLIQILGMPIGNKVLILHLCGSSGDPCATAVSRDVRRLLVEHCSRQQRIHLHCCTLIKEERRAWSDAFPEAYFGFTGKVWMFTGPQDEALRDVPIKRLLLETDAPYFKPERYMAGNTPMYLGELAQEIAIRRGETFAEVVVTANDNARRLYDLQE
ncbi:uncharacterized protein LOC121419978 [Lytechinus variegatus]|uniref:uncharacterized protein LOC121419978 n=1 Tax=Lytechinus variegatus TaxID=7654 RepID=UPI001BB151D2|nr:uncharacterized protein LOC121419978 [Lytechinus variegatus]